MAGSPDVLVIGGGIVGASSAYHLARRGASVTLLEQDRLASGATGRNLGWIRVARRLRVGDVWVNTHYVRLAESPFGGVKQSGIGRELGMEGLDAYLESKRVCIDSSPTFHIR